MAESLFVEERRRTILEQLKKEGRVSVNVLSETLNVSAVTIRQDLRALESEGLLERTYGGAVMRATATPELAFDIRRQRQNVEKRAIGKLAAELVEDGYAIALDSSSTTTMMIPYLKQLEHLTVLTNGLFVAQQFLDCPNITVIMPGGKLRRESVSLVTRPDMVPEVNVNIGFLGARGVTLGAGVTEASLEEADMKRAAIARCREVVILADSSKWGRVAPYTFIAAGQVSRFITTSRTAPEIIQAFQDAGSCVDVVPVEA